MRTRPSLDIQDAETIAQACRAAAAGAPVSIAVVDEAGGLLVFHRLDGARAYSADLAIRKARTAAAIAAPTRILAERLRDQPASGADILAMPGGLPVVAEGQCAGGVGVSGGSTELDEAIAAAGLAGLVAPGSDGGL